MAELWKRQSPFFRRLAWWFHLLTWACLQSCPPLSLWRPASELCLVHWVWRRNREQGRGQLSAVLLSLYGGEEDRETPGSPGSHLTGAAVILGFSGSTMESVMMDPEEMLLIPALPKPPNAGTFFPDRSASLLACCSSFAFLLISALASRSWVC